MDSGNRTQSSVPVTVRVILSKRQRNDNGEAFHKRWKQVEASSNLKHAAEITSGLASSDESLISNHSKSRRTLRRTHSSLLYTLYMRSIGVIKSCIHMKIIQRKHIIPFSALNTPSHDAVLALDRSGSYIISLSDTIISCSQFASFSICFYAYPSPHRMTKSRLECNTSLKVLSIPLTTRKDGEDSFCCSQIPVKILIAADGQIGIALFGKSFQVESDPEQSQEEVLGYMTLFIPPGPGNMLNEHGTYTRYSNISLTKTMNSYTIRNLLWKTNIVPFRGEIKMETHRLTRSVKISSTAHVFFLDDEDNFLIHWIDFHSFHQIDDRYVMEDSDHDTSKPTLCYDDPCMLPWNDETLRSEDDPTLEGITKRPTVVYRAVLRMGVVLDDIIAHRQSLFGKSISHFKYAYSLICLHSNGRNVDVVLSFTDPRMIKSGKKTKNHAFAVLVSIDIFSQTYQQIQWYHHSNCTGTKKLQKWCDEIATHKRMIDMNIGPYCISETKKDFHAFKIQLHEENVLDPSDWDPEIWSTDLPKAIAISSMYPNCDVVTNDAILKNAPVAEIKARDFPIHILYC